MKRNSLGQLFERSDLTFFKFVPIKNNLIDFYLDGFKKREKKEEKLWIVLINYITVFSFIVCIIKYVAGFKKLSHTTKLILFDLSSLLGGIELYNRIFLVLGLVLGLITHLTLRWTTSGRHREWTQVFEYARGKVSPEFSLTRSQMIEIQPKLVKAMKVIYKTASIYWIVLSK